VKRPAQILAEVWLIQEKVMAQASEFVKTLIVAFCDI
jgi:hypothetical protein